jgi:hypothetical protein
MTEKDVFVDDRGQRRNFLRHACVGGASAFAVGSAHAIEPVTTAAILGIGGFFLKIIGGVVVVVAIAKAANGKEAYAARSSRPVGFHDDVGSNHEVVPDNRGQIIKLPDGGKILCSASDGQWRPAGTPPSERHGDLSPAELMPCESAPFAEERRPPAESAGSAQRRLDAMEEILQRRLKKLRYVRQVHTAKGDSFMLYSAVLKREHREFLTLWDQRQRGQQRIVRAYLAPAWTLEGGRHVA